VQKQGGGAGRFAFWRKPVGKSAAALRDDESFVEKAEAELPALKRAREIAGRLFDGELHFFLRARPAERARSLGAKTIRRQVACRLSAALGRV
jgi:hypothetical protein